MSIFDEIALEAAQNAFNQTGDAEIALWEVEASLKERGKLEFETRCDMDRTPSICQVAIIRIDWEQKS